MGTLPDDFEKSSDCSELQSLSLQSLVLEAQKKKTSIYLGSETCLYDHGNSWLNNYSLARLCWLLMVPPKGNLSHLDSDKWLGRNRLTSQEAMSAFICKHCAAFEAPTWAPASNLRVQLGCSSSLPLIYGKEEEELPQHKWTGKPFLKIYEFYFHVCISV